MFLSRVQVFPPSFQELPPPALDLFDLDEHFSSERVRVAQITNKCQSHNLITNASCTKLHVHTHTHTHTRTHTHTHTCTHTLTHRFQLQRLLPQDPGLRSARSTQSHPLVTCATSATRKCTSWKECLPTVSSSTETASNVHTATAS